MHYLILPVPLSLLVSKENPGPHFVQRLFFLISIPLNIMHLVCISICYVFYVLCPQQILTTVMTNIVVDKSADNAEPLSICFYHNIQRQRKFLFHSVTKIVTRRKTKRSL